MLVEQRTYQLVPGKVTAYLERYAAEGLALQTRHLGRLAGWYTAESGDTNGIVHLWAYRSHQERQERRARLAADPDWQRYSPPMYTLILQQHSVVLRPAPFFRDTLLRWFPDLEEAPAS